jgi:hypothetical protein
VELVVLAAITAGVLGFAIPLVGGRPDPAKVRRALARARIQRIDQVADGSSGAVRGRVVVEREPIAAPLSARPCVYWLVTFDEVGTGGDYVELGCLEKGIPFLLEGDGARARVVPERPRLAVPGKSSSRPVLDLDTQDWDPMLELARKVCRRPNYPTSTLRATEYLLAPGMEITVMGWCTREPDPEAAADVRGYRGQLPTRPVISGSRRTRLLVG